MQYTHLTYEERSHISKMIALNMSIRDIAKELERSPSTISREVKRNSSMDKDSKVIYKFKNADEKYRCRIHKQRIGKYVLVKQNCNSTP